MWGKIMQRMEEWMTNLYYDDDNKKKQNKEDKGKRKSDIKVEGLGRWKDKGKEKGSRKCKC